MKTQFSDLSMEQLDDGDFLLGQSKVKEEGPLIELRPGHFQYIAEPHSAIETSANIATKRKIHMKTTNSRSGIAFPASSLESMDEHPTYEQLCARLAELTPLRNLICRVEAGEQISTDEFADALSKAGQGVIDDMEARLEEGAVPGLPYLPRRLNPGCPEFRAAMERLVSTNAAPTLSPFDLSTPSPTALSASFTESASP